jgi:hypothetical protein
MYPPSPRILALLVSNFQIAQIASKVMGVVIATFREELAFVSQVSVKPSVQLLEVDGILTLAHRPH